MVMTTSCGLLKRTIAPSPSIAEGSSGSRSPAEVWNCTLCIPMGARTVSVQWPSALNVQRPVDDPLAASNAGPLVVVACWVSTGNEVAGDSPNTVLKTDDA